MTTAKWLQPDQQQAWRSYRRMKALLDQRLYQDLNAETGLSEADYDVLSTLTEGPDRTWRSTDLAERLLWSASRLSHQIRRMEERGLVRRKKIAGDGRVALIELTAEGRKAIRAAAPGHVRSVRAHFVAVLGERDLAVLGRMCDKLVAHLESI